jgi:hypothetical protein
MTEPLLKSTRTTLTDEPAEAEVDVGVAPAFWTNLLELFLLVPEASVTQTYPPADVEELSTTVPENTPLPSIVPVPNEPVVGAVLPSSWLNLILQVVQLASKPPPETVNVEPRAPVDGLKLTKLSIAYVALVTLVVSASEWTVTVKLAALSAFTMPAAWLKVMTTWDSAAMLWSPAWSTSKSGIVIATSRPDTATAAGVTLLLATPPPTVMLDLIFTVDAAMDDGTVVFELKVT